MFAIKVRSKRLVIPGIAVLLGILLLAGCGGVDSLRDKLSAPEENKPGAKDLKQGQLQLAPEKPALTAENGKKVLLYFVEADGKGLVAEERVIPRVEGIARATVHELLAGPTPGSGLRPTLPYGTTLKDINVKSDGTVVVDFSKELLANYSGASPDDSLTVQSIVHTLTQFPAVKQVQILVDGKQAARLGEVDIRSTLTADSSLVLPVQATPGN